MALHRTGKLADAGRVIGVNETPVARRIKVFEQALGVSLFVRSSAGRYQSTDTGLEIIDHAEAVERENGLLRERVVQIAERIMGVVCISSVPIIINRILVPKLAGLTQEYPDLTIELVPDSSNVDLKKRESDLAVRFSRPTFGVFQTRAQKLGTLEFTAYGPCSASAGEMDALGWISYDDANSGLPQAQRLEAALGRKGAERSPLRVSDAETALEAAARGLGKTFLPRSIADADSRLRAYSYHETSSPLGRDVWLLSHADQSARQSVSAVKKWLTKLRWNGSP